MAQERVCPTVVALLVLIPGCGAREIQAVGDAGGGDTFVEAGAPLCPGATAGPYDCGASVRACDPSRPPGLPSGACTVGETCALITVRPANCDCLADDGPRFPWSCSCVGGSWSCALGGPDGRICGCSFPRPFDASCESGTEVFPDGCVVGLQPDNGAKIAAFPAEVTLRCATALPDLATRMAIVNGLRLFSEASGTWVWHDATAVESTATTVRWSIAPRAGLPRTGAWVLRAGPLPVGSKITWASSKLLRCEGEVESHFTVVP